MKYVKMLGLAAVAAAALMAFVGASTASATTLTGVGGATLQVGDTMHAESEGKAVLDAPFGNVECNSTVHGTVSTNGDAGLPAEGELTETPNANAGLSWTNCGGDTVTSLKGGTLSIDSENTVRSNGARVTVIHLGVHCIFETANTKVGILTESATTGATATMHISANIPRVGGSGGIFCGSSAPWTGSYKVNTPDTLNVD